MNAPFHKSYYSPTQIVSLLQSRGLAIENPDEAVSYVKRIGYYRLSAYCYPFLSMPKTAQQFRSGAQFGKVLSLYRFDRKLRQLVFNECEK